MNKKENKEQKKKKHKSTKVYFGEVFKIAKIISAKCNSQCKSKFSLSY